MNRDDFIGIPKEFNEWWDSDWEADCPKPNIRKDSPLWWAYQGWMAGAKAEREACARVCEEHSAEIHGYDKHGYADAIRARGEK